MGKQWKGFVAGAIVTTLAFGVATSALAAYQKQATLNYSGINITLNGKSITPTDANGDVVEPFAIDGTTYLPVRGIASAMGLNVAWDQVTQTVSLTENGGVAQQSSGSVIMDKNGIKITYLGVAQRTDGLEGYNIKLKIENNTSKNYTIQVNNLSINGVMSRHVIFSSDVVSNKTANDAIWVYGFEEDGITAPIATAEFNFHVFDSDTWDTYFDSDTITLAP